MATDNASLAHRPAQAVEPLRVLGAFKRRAGIRQFGLSRPLLAGEIALQVGKEVTHHDTFPWPVVGVLDDQESAGRVEIAIPVGL